MYFDVQVETSPRSGIADPEGATIERSLPALGFDGIVGVRVGKSFRFSVEGSNEDEVFQKVADVCNRFLTNPVIEDFHISIGSAAAEASG